MTRPRSGNGQYHHDLAAMAAQRGVPFRPLQILNIPPSDADPHYWTLAAFQNRVEQCKNVIRFWEVQGIVSLPTCEQVDLAAGIVGRKGGFAAALDDADGEWHCQWSPQTPFPHAVSLVFSTTPPESVRFVLPPLNTATAMVD